MTLPIYSLKLGNRCLYCGKRQKGSVLKNTESGYNNLTPCLNSQGIEYGRMMFCVHVDFLEFR